MRRWPGPAAARQHRRLTIDGTSHDLARLSAEEIVDLGVAMVPEGRRLFPRLTVLENLMLGRFPQGGPA